MAPPTVTSFVRLIASRHCPTSATCSESFSARRRIAAARPLPPHSVAGGYEFGDTTALLQNLEALRRFGQVFDLSGSDDREVLVDASQSCRIDEEPSTSGEGEIGNECRLAGGHDGLHHLHPVVHLVDDVAVDAIRFARGEQLLGIVGTVGHGHQELHAGAELFQRTGDSLDVGREVISDVRPGRALLFEREAGENQTHARSDRVCLRGWNKGFVGGQSKSCEQTLGCRRGAEAAPGCQKTTTADAALTTGNYGRTRFHCRLPWRWAKTRHSPTGADYSRANQAIEHTTTEQVNGYRLASERIPARQLVARRPEQKAVGGLLQLCSSSKSSMRLSGSVEEIVWPKSTRSVVSKD